MRHIESQHQRAFISRCRLHPQARRAFAIPNGGHRNKVTAAILKAEGVLPGVPDVCLPITVPPCSALWIEFKSHKGRISSEQLDFAAHLVEHGHVVVVAYSWGRAWHWTERYLAGELTPAFIVDK